MELELTDSQELFRAETARFIGRFPPSVLRASFEGNGELPSGYLHDAAELGWFAPLIPEACGGGSVSGQGVQELAIIAEERGRQLQPGPFASINVVALALASQGTDARWSQLLTHIASAETIATWVPRATSGAAFSDNSLHYQRDEDSFRLFGHSNLVQYGGHADYLLVTATGSEGLTQFLLESGAPGIAIENLIGHDISQQYSRIIFNDVRASSDELVGFVGEADLSAEEQLQLALVLTSAESVGAMDELFELTRQHALDRVAFGRPIGSFQAVKHQLADMSLSIEAAKSITVAATRAVQTKRRDAGEIASIAKAWVSDVSIEVAQGCFQVFGGIGFTWEHDLHLFLRRLTMNSLLFGDADWHRERICQLHGL